MRTNTLNPLHPILSAVLLTTVRIILPLLIVLYGVFNFSVHYWILLGLLVVGIMAISDRLSRINASYKKDTTNNSNLSKTDGGTFSVTEKSRPTGNTYPVVQDGGIYNLTSQK